MHSNPGRTLLAAAIALAIGSGAAFAAPPAATQLPGQGRVMVGDASAGGIAAGAQTITLNDHTVINWGTASGATINTGTTAQPGGFNVGSSAVLNFAGAFGVLNVDVSGNPSQIFGTLTSQGNLFVANSNGIVVGPKAAITAGGAHLGLIANALGSTAGFAGDLSTVGYNGTGGDVTVLAGAALGSSGDYLVSGGGIVNVDLGVFGAGDVALSAGMPGNGGPFATVNSAAVLNVSGELATGTLTTFQSGGNATNAGTLQLDGNAAIAGTLTNNGTLDLGTGFAIDGALANNKTVTQSGAAEVGGGINNPGSWDGGGFDLTAGGLVNDALMANIGALEVDGGDFVNNGEFGGTGANIDTFDGASVANSGVLTGVDNVLINGGGDFVNSGTMTLDGVVYTMNGSATNSGDLTLFGSIYTGSDDTAAGFTPGADYSITNTGTITGEGLYLSANAIYNGMRGGTAVNDSTGSVLNTGTLRVYDLGIGMSAWNDVTWAGTVQRWNGSKFAPLSAANPVINGIEIAAGGLDEANEVFNTNGIATLATDVVTDEEGAVLAGDRIRVMANITAVDADGNPAGWAQLLSGDRHTDDYSIRVALGKTVTADTVYLAGWSPGAAPNVILQGTLAGNTIMLGDFTGVGYFVSDVFTGPSGGLQMWNNGASDPYLYINATGRVKTAPYLNDANFRYNYLPVTITDGSTLNLEIDPSGMSGVPLSGLNLLVDGDVTLDSDLSAAAAGAPPAGGTAVTGVTVVPNTHLVLQSTGNIEAGALNGEFYWPGYVYLGTIGADADGNPLPGTLGLGQISIDGDFSNVLPGDVAGASGIHFITQLPLQFSAATDTVTTNANAWVNFGSGMLTELYRNGNGADGPFFGGSQGPGNVIEYGPLAPASFVTRIPVSDR